MVEGIVRELGMDIYTLLYLEWITNKDLQYSTWNSAQNVIWQLPGEGSLGENRYMYMYDWVSLHCSPKTITTLLVGYIPIQNKKFKKKNSVAEEITFIISQESMVWLGGSGDLIQTQLILLGLVHMSLLSWQSKWGLAELRWLWLRWHSFTPCISPNISGGCTRQALVVEREEHKRKPMCANHFSRLLTSSLLLFQWIH